MKKRLLAVLMGTMMALSACGGGEPAAPTNEEIIAAAQALHFDGYEEKTIGEYTEGSEVYPNMAWYIVSEETVEAEELEDILDEAEDRGYDAELEKLVCLHLEMINDMYFAVDAATAEARLLYTYSSYGDDADYNIANFLNRKDIGTLKTVEELCAAAEKAYLPGYTDKTIGEYADMATMVAGNTNCQMLNTGNEQNVLLTIMRECPDFDIEKDRLMSFNVYQDDLNGNNVLIYYFYIGVDRDTGEAAVLAASVKDMETKKSGTFYGGDVKKLADIFVDGANWTE